MFNTRNRKGNLREYGSGGSGAILEIRRIRLTGRYLDMAKAVCQGIAFLR